MTPENKQLGTHSVDISKRITRTYKLSDFPSQIYRGETLLNNLHGSGIYFIEKPNGKIYIDGQFYCNKLEGYCNVYYEDGSSFHGLFKDNRRFGPGVFSYPSGHQDVGIWNGFSLVRLSVTVHEQFLPKLAESYEGMAHLRKYRYVLPLGMPKNLDMIADMLQTFATDGVLIENATKFYDECVRNRNSLFFNTTLFNDIYFTASENSTEEIARLEEELKKIDKILTNIQEEKPILFEKLEYCKRCCHEDEQIKSGTSSRKFETEVPNASLREFAINMDDIRSTITETMTFDETISYVISDFINTPPDLVEEIKHQCACVCEEEMNIEDLAFLEQQYENLVKEELFYTNIQRGLLERLANSATEVETDDTRDVLAWNNEKLMTDISKHSFLHRKSENRINVKLSAIFESERFIEFPHQGQYEIDCEQFLIQSGSGYLPTVMDHLRKPNIDVNVTDSRGNTAVFFASLKHSKDVIRVLMNFGANLNQINDEGLTPLNMCILSYLAEKNNIENWEKVFLPQDSISFDEEDISEWYPGISTHKQTKGDYQSLKRGTIVENFFNIEYKEPNTIIVELSSTGPKATYQIKNNPEDGTIRNLLKFGANPNVGEVPYPALVLSIYSENPSLVEDILKHGADIFVKTPQKNLNCLHIIASLECNKYNVEICSVLLRNGCDPNVKTEEQHWPEQMVRITGNYHIPCEFEDTRKNPLHMLCLRKDFRADRGNYFDKMAKLLIESGINIDDTYLGLNALELAILSSNWKLIKLILNTGLLDPYRLIDTDIGNTLTLFLSERFRDSLPLDECKQIIEFLVNSEVNPLHSVGRYGNVVEFMEKHDCASKGKKGEALKKGDDTQLSLRNLLKTLTRKTILADICIKAAKHLYNLAEANLLDNETVTVLAEYLTPELVIKNLKLIFEQGDIPMDRFDANICQQVLDFVRKYRKTSKKPKSKARLTKSETNTDTLYTSDFENLLNSKKVIMKRPHSDVNYEVCFQCLKSNDRTMTKCPKCEMLYFCSTQCNKVNLKQKMNGHACALNIFDDTGDWVRDKAGLMELCERADHNCQERYFEKKRQQKELERRREEDERRLDIYGSRHLHNATNGALVKSLTEDSVRDNRNYDVIKFENSSHFDTPSQKPGETSAVSMRRRSDSMNHTLNETSQRLSLLRAKHEKQKKHVALDIKREITRIPKKKVQKITRGSCELAACKVTEAGEEITSPFEVFPNLEEPYIIEKKTTNNPPERTKFFIEMLKKYFPNVDLSFLIVPYICYADGHLYYQFSEESPSKNYSLS